MDIVLVTLSFVVRFLLMLVVLFVGGPIFIIQCMNGSPSWGAPEEYVCSMAQRSAILYGVLFAGFVVYAIYSDFNADKFFGWMFHGEHYGNRAIQRKAAKEFGRLMIRQDFDDARMATLFQNMGKTRQRMWRAKYEARTEQARRLREMLDTQRKAIDADTRLADALLKEVRKR